MSVQPERDGQQGLRRIAGQGTELPCGSQGRTIEDGVAGRLGNFGVGDASLSVQTEQQEHFAFQFLFDGLRRIQQMFAERTLGALQLLAAGSGGSERTRLCGLDAVALGADQGGRFRRQRGQKIHVKQGRFGARLGLTAQPKARQYQRTMQT